MTAAKRWGVAAVALLCGLGIGCGDALSQPVFIPPEGLSECQPGPHYSEERCYNAAMATMREPIEAYWLPLPGESIKDYLARLPTEVWIWVRYSKDARVVLGGSLLVLVVLYAAAALGWVVLGLAWVLEFLLDCWRGRR